MAVSRESDFANARFGANVSVFLELRDLPPFLVFADAEPDHKSGDKPDDREQCFKEGLHHEPTFSYFNDAGEIVN
jgi:hypothetical protein